MSPSRPRTSRRIHSAAIALILGITLAGCSSDDPSVDAQESDNNAPADDAPADDEPTDDEPTDDEPADDQPSDTPDAADSTEDTAPETDDPAPTESPDGQTVTAPESGVQFVVPDDWQAMALSDLTDEELQEIVELASEASDVSPEELRQQAEQGVELLVMDMEQDGFGDNINVMRIPGAAGLLTDEDVLLEQLEASGMNPDELTAVETEVGDGFRADYTLPVGAVDVAGSGLFLGVDGDIVNITVSTDDAGDTAEIMDTLVGTLRAS